MFKDYEISNTEMFERRYLACFMPNEDVETNKSDRGILDGWVTILEGEKGPLGSQLRDKIWSQLRANIRLKTSSKAN